MMPPTKKNSAHFKATVTGRDMMYRAYGMRKNYNLTCSLTRLTFVTDSLCDFLSAHFQSVNNFPTCLSPHPSGLSNMEGVQGNNRRFQALTYELQSNL